MASLTKDSKGRSPYWTACYTTADGRQLKKSTKQTDRKKALEIALTLERAEKMAKLGTLTETRARELIGEILERTTGESLPFYSAEAWLRDWLRGKEIAKSERTHAIYARQVENFLANLGGRAKMNLAAIGVADIARFRDSQIAAGKVAKTVRLAVSVLRTALNAAKRQGILSHNPVEAVELPALPKSEDGDSQRKPFTPEQVQALLKAAPPEWRGAILVGFFTGARLTDITNLAWNAIDLPRRLVTFRAKKTGRMLMIPLHPTLEAHLLKMSAPHSGKAPLFPSLAGRTASRLGADFLKIMKQAGVQGELIHAPKPGGVGRELRTLSFHSLRHAFNSQLANAGVAQEIRQIFTGHSTAEMNEHYTHREIEPLRAAIATIPGIQRKARAA